jgi:photosystem II stability/assembly factor-like uncharacterized protein
MRTPQRILCLAAAGLVFAAAVPAQPIEIDSSTFAGLEARPIGPAVMSGRIAAIDGVADDPITLYVGSASGGVWRSKDAGVTFKPVFDKQTQSIGAVTVDPKNPQTVWVGTGESWTRNSVSVGDGVYKTTDGGDNWQRMGLEDSERIARIRVSPANSDTVWVCATGHLWNDNEERGVYKTADAGKTWKRVLWVDAKTGCSDLAVDPQEPDILYAGMWQFRRGAASFSSGGPGSGLYKSSDGGETWKKVEAGLPKGDKGRIAVAVAPSRPSTVYAVVESKNTALYRSDDTGETWKEMNSSFNIQARPFYFAVLTVDPTDHNTVYKPGLSLTLSTDGGKTFTFPFGQGGGVHGDLHALWINPKNPHELVLGTDGGVYISNDKGGHWRHVKSLPVAQFYHVSYDMDWPYNVYGGLQDNGSWSAPSRGPAGIQNRNWRSIGFGDGFWAFRDATDPDVAYVEYQGGKISRIRLSTGENRDIQPLPAAGDPEYRFNWNTPIHLSPTQPGTIYIGSQFLFRSRDRGESWEKISPDLTTNDPKRQQQQKSGGLTIDNSTAENHTTIFTISESPRNKDVIWVGTDDGYVQVTRDSGKTWTNVTKNLPGVPANTWVSTVEAGRFDEGTAYVTLDGHTTGDMKTYVLETADFGQTWKSLATADLAGYAHVIRQDLENPDLLFLGTEFGLYISVDGGARWARYTGGDFPKVAVRDIAIHPRDGDLILATHGRGVYILDDLTPLRKLTKDVLEQEVAFLPSRPAAMVIPSSIQDFPGDEEYVGQSPEEAAYVTYYLKKRHIVGDLKLEVYDDKGQLVSTLPAGKRKGVNRVAWPMRTKGPRTPAGNAVIQAPFSFFGPRVLAGTYTVKLTKGGQTLDSQVQLVADPRSTHTAEDRKLQYDTVMKLHGMMERLTYLVDATLGARDALRQRAAALPKGDRLRKQAESLADELTKFHATLVATGEGGWLSGEEQLREKLGQLYGGVNGYEGRPTKSQLDQVTVLADSLDKAAARLGSFAKGELAAVNSGLTAHKLEPVKLLSEEEWKKKS